MIFTISDFKSMISGDFHDFYNLCDFKSGDFYSDF